MAYVRVEDTGPDNDGLPGTIESPVADKPKIILQIVQSGPDLEDRTETGHKPFQFCFKEYPTSPNVQRGNCNWDAARECEWQFYTYWEQFKDQPPPIYRG
ncbi:MAG: hypothetical protein ABII01_04025 [Candidatus Woesearchaeota archaeon]